MMRHFVSLGDARAEGLSAILADAAQRKQARAGRSRGGLDADAPLDGHVLAMVFEKSSTRTRVSFDVAMRQLGGSAIVLDAGTMQLGRGETIADTARVLSRMADAIMLRTDDHAKVDELQRHATVPVINGLTDRSHPCQIMADLLTIVERGKPLARLEMAWLGDGNNVAYSLVEGAGLLGYNIRLGVPEGFDCDAVVIEQARNRGARISVFRDARAAVDGAQVVVTDTWVSMGQSDGDLRVGAMAPFQVNAQLMALADKDAMFLHCLPAHRGEEVTDAVIDGPQSAVWDEAENRIHAQKSVLRWVFGQI